AIGWLLDVFDFRKRLKLTQWIIAIALSISLSPVLLYWVRYFLSTRFALILLFILLAFVFLLQWRSRTRDHQQTDRTLTPESWRYQKVAMMIGGIWVIFCIVWLVDWQFGHQLYINAVSYDYTSRVAMVDAVTRTGVPPINTSYYPGQPTQLTFLYFFWYILGSMADILGSRWISAYHAVIASTAWCGLGLMAVIALYLRMRTSDGLKARRLSLVAVQLLLVSGLDVVLVTPLLVKAKLLLGYIPTDGRMEGWNIPIMSWVGGTIWVPNHVAGAVACLVALLLLLDSYERPWQQQLKAAIVAGAALASAVGLSVWLPLIFSVFWIMWMIVVLLQHQRPVFLLFMFLTGLIALFFAAPFLAGVLNSTPSAGNLPSQFPIAFYVRPFSIVAAFTSTMPVLAQGLINLIFLPINYLFELGFFFVCAFLWLFGKYRKKSPAPFPTVEILLLATVVISLSFFYSRVIPINDMGIRPWLLGQFVLLIWTVDVVDPLVNAQNFHFPKLFKAITKFQYPSRVGYYLVILLTLGLMTTSLEMLMLRFWTIGIDANIVGFPSEFSPDTQLGSRTYAARQAYEYIRDYLPLNWIVQDNPTTILDRPSGLYGTRQMVISDHTAYGVSAEAYESLVNQVKVIFESETLTWEQIDSLCQEYSIDLLIFKDIDPIWRNIELIGSQRSPVYDNDYYALFQCGVDQSFVSAH
ncbi:MAG TPA: hypothetical protein DEH22_17800, partial [Chloroflexi bacterium]|nr:hypothetical protein [Chloroflexota bacterium]